MNTNRREQRRWQVPVFPDVESADETGLLFVGGQLSISWLIGAYTQGIFPWPVVAEGMEILAWFAPDPRAIIEFDEFHISKRLRRRLRSGEFQISCDQAYRGVMEACAAPRRDDPDGGTWITRSMVDAYCELHRLGIAHSVEVWKDKQLVGGTYGVSFGGLFAAESMFHRERDASKVALAYLVYQLREQGFGMLDIQQMTDHSLSLGAREISRQDYMTRLESCLELDVQFGDRLLASRESW